VRYVNVPIEQLIAATQAALDKVFEQGSRLSIPSVRRSLLLTRRRRWTKGQAVWFGCDCGKFMYRKVRLVLLLLLLLLALLLVLVLVLVPVLLAAAAAAAARAESQLTLSRAPQGRAVRYRGLPLR